MMEMNNNCIDEIEIRGDVVINNTAPGPMPSGFTSAEYGWVDTSGRANDED